MRILIVVSAIILFGCKINNNSESKKIVEWKDEWENPAVKDSVLKSSVIHSRVKDCLLDPSIIVMTRDWLSDPEPYNKMSSLGDINGDQVNDSIMVIPELNISEENGMEDGRSIIFSDKRIPRIEVDQACLQTNFVFVVGDIDDDGTMELGKYYTRCVSRFKDLELISLKKGKWKVYGKVTFDIFFGNPPKEQRIRKTGANEFEMREIKDSSEVKIDRWIKFKL